MAARSVLFVGGTGRISSACVVRAIESGCDVSVLNRSTTTARPLPEGVRSFTADVRDPESVRAALGGREFDAVANFVVMTEDQARADIEQFAGRTAQYVFISSASAYQKPVARIPIVESTPLRNPYWQYSRDKIACELAFSEAYRTSGFPVTIVRPSHTYDKTMLPFDGGWTVVDRMRRSKPVVVHGDGTSLWTLTHHDDFARAFVSLLGNPQAVGDAVHITSDEVLTWNQIHEIVARAAGADARLVHVASESIATALPAWGPGLLGDKSHSLVFDNAKIRHLAPGWTATIPYAVGAREVLEWFDADPARQVVDPVVDEAMDALVARHG